MRGGRGKNAKTPSQKESAKQKYTYVRVEKAREGEINDGQCVNNNNEWTPKRQFQISPSINRQVP